MTREQGPDLERELAQRYRQPGGVEQFGIEAIPEDRRTVRWYDLFSIILNFLVNPGTILVGALAVASGLSFWAAVVSLVLGIALAFGAYVIMATVGVDHGLPGQVATRFAFGIRGAKIGPSILRTISSIYWFSFQTIAGALGIVAVLHAMTGHDYNLALVSVVFAVAQVLIATIGYDLLKSLSRVAFFSKLFITVLLLWVLISQQGHSPAQVFAFGGKAGWSWALMAVWVNTSAAAWLSMITDAADFCRYSRSRMDMWIGTLLAAVLGEAIAVFLGGYAVAAVAARTANPFTVMATGSSVWILVALLIYVVFDNWTINVLNLYTGGLAICNIFTRLGRFWATLIASAVGVALSLFPNLINGYNAQMNIMGGLFAPIAGVLIVDYLVIRRMRIDVPALFEKNGRYWYWGGFNWVAIGWTVIGFAISFLIPDAWVKTASTGIITGAGYLVTTLSLRARMEILARASAPVEVTVDLAELDRRLAGPGGVAQTPR
jgi:NCS1 nucleoside transporter family